MYINGCILERRLYYFIMVLIIYVDVWTTFKSETIELYKP